MAGEPMKAHMREMETDASTIHEKVALVANQLAALTLLLQSEESKEAAAALNGSWARFVEHLDLPPASETRECPRCRHVVMIAATLCGYCWVRLTPPH